MNWDSVDLKEKEKLNKFVGFNRILPVNVPTMLVIKFSARIYLRGKLFSLESNLGWLRFLSHGVSYENAQFSCQDLWGITPCEFLIRNCISKAWKECGAQHGRLSLTDNGFKGCYRPPPLTEVVVRGHEVKGQWADEPCRYSDTWPSSLNSSSICG